MAQAYKEYTGTLSNGRLSISAKAGRRSLIVSNNSDTVMTLAMNGTTATASIGIAIPAGTSIWLGQRSDGGSSNCPETAMSLFCAGASKAYTVYEC